MKFKKLIPIILASFIGVLNAAVIPYNKDLTAHKDVEKSTYYKVEIKQNGTTYETFVNMAKANDVIDLTISREKALQNRTISWASFDFSGTVTVSVTVLNTQAIPTGGTIKLVPSQAGISTTKVGTNKVEFTLTNPDQLSLEIGTDGYKNGLMLFANPLETEVMDKNASDVFVCNPSNGIPSIPTSKTKVYFTDCVHDLGEWYIPSHIKEVYLQGNSAVMGKFNLKDMNGPIKIYGRGSLVNDKDEYQRTEQGLIKTLGTTNSVTIKDIVLVRREKLFGISLHGTANLISNVKLIGGFNQNNDGILVGKGNSLCENSFLMVNDDGLKTFTEDAVYKNTTMWVLTNGAAIQTGWSSKSANNVTVDGLYLIHAEWEKAGKNTNNGAILNSRLKDVLNGDNNLQTNIVIKNVYTEHAVHQFIRLDNDPISTHRIDGFEFSNWNVYFLEGGQNILAYTKGYIKNIKFNNFKVNGSCISSLEEAKSKYNFITNASTTGLTFNCGTTSTSTRLEAEAYSAMSGVTKQTTSDTGGGSNIASINNNDYVDYAFNVANAGTYTTKFRVSSALNGGTIQVLKGTTVLGSVNVAVTGGWQTWTTVTGPSINLTSTGTQTIRLKFVNANTTGYLMNLNWWECAGSAAVKVSRMETEEIEAPSLNISLSPNPAKDFVNLYLDTVGATILLYSTDNKLMKKIISTSKVNQINVSDLFSGIYFIKIISVNKSKTLKFIKN